MRNREPEHPSDEGVQPIAGIILMFAITIVRTAGSYLWVTGFAADRSTPEKAIAAAKGIDLDGDNDVEWIRITLAIGENEPYPIEDLAFLITAPNGTDLSTRGYPYLCTRAPTDGTDNRCAPGSDVFSNGHTWEAGSNLWTPCQSTSPDGDTDASGTTSSPSTSARRSSSTRACDTTVDDPPLLRGVSQRSNRNALPTTTSVDPS